MSVAELMLPVGPVAEAFVGDLSFIKAIMGPVGSAKTTSCIRCMVESPGHQAPGPDGVRRARWAVVRDTYSQLKTNVLNSWFTWFPQEAGDWNGEEMRHRLRWQVSRLDGKGFEIWELEVYFRAMGDNKAEQVLKGLELTGLWLNETDTLAKDVMAFGVGRIGRYPPAKLGGCQYRAVICDFNAPDADNWTYPLLVEKQMPIDAKTAAVLRAELGERFNISFHRQPGGRSIDPPPENIKNLPAGYYQTQLLGMPEHLVRRIVDNEFGAVRNGQPVYPEYNDDFHCAKVPFEADPAVPMGMAVDGGMTPAAVFGQRMPDGQIRTISEVVVFADGDHDVLARMGPVEFGKVCGEHWLEKYADCELGGAWADPAAFYGDDSEYGWQKLFWKAFRDTVDGAARGVALKPAPCTGNRLPERLEAVRRGLTNNCGSKPGQLLSPACRYLRRGFNNAYVITRVALSNGGGRFADKPLKNDFSHVHDAKQYLDLGLTKRGAMERRASPRAPGRKPGAKAIFGAGPFAHRERRA